MNQESMPEEPLEVSSINPAKFKKKLGVEAQNRLEKKLLGYLFNK